MFEFSQEGIDFIKKETSRYETKDSAIIPCLFMAQKENQGWVSPEVIEALSLAMALPLSKIQAVFSFYTMFNKKPVGRFHIQVCCNISCSINKSRELKEALLQHLQVKEGEVTSDGKYSLTQVECLGACGQAPMMQINEDYYEHLSPSGAIEILRGLK